MPEARVPVAAAQFQVMRFRSPSATSTAKTPSHVTGEDHAPFSHVSMVQPVQA